MSTALYRRGRQQFIAAIQHGCDSDGYKAYEQSHDFMRLAADYLYSALSYVINFAPPEGAITFYTDDDWAPPALVWRILRDMRGMMPAGFFDRIQVIDRNSLRTVVIGTID